MPRTVSTLKRCAILISAAWAFACCDSAYAATVPDGNIQLDNSLAVPNHVTTSDLSSPISSTVGYVSVGANPQGQPSVSASVSAPDGGIGRGRAALGYWVHVSGSDPTANVPILFLASLSVGASGLDLNNNQAGSATAEFGLQQYNANPFTTPNSFVAQLYQQDLSIQLPEHAARVSNLSDLVRVHAGDFIGVSIIADVQAQYGGIVTASADPYFQIDPVFLLDHPDYSLSFSPFVGNDPPPAAGVPEPLTWALMLVGFGAIGVAMRRERRQLTHYRFA